MGKEKNVKVYLPGGSGLEKSVADNYLWIILHEHNCHGFCLMMERFSSCLFWLALALMLASWWS